MNKPSYIKFLKQNWKELLIMSSLYFTVIGAIIKLFYMKDLWERMEERGEEYEYDVHTGKYIKSDKGEFTEIIHTKSPYNEYVVLTLMYSMVPVGVIWLAILIPIFL